MTKEIKHVLKKQLNFIRIFMHPNQGSVAVLLFMLAELTRISNLNLL